MKPYLCRSGAPGKYSVCALVSTVRVRPRHKKCGRTQLVCGACLQRLVSKCAVPVQQLLRRRQLLRSLQSGIRCRRCNQSFRGKDYVVLEDLDVEIHLPKEGFIISKESRSQDPLIHGIKFVLSRN